ncbi:ROK family protein [Thiohalobacter sp.]|uniref:ROK family protein n=1 Tax=Thiohalobacter sp. TaxID=2025948 RepID=UPI002635F132|nr:ROK family protein [Thiohalobacter sp.]
MRFGIDLGGTKIELAAIEDSGAIRWRRRVPTPRGDYEATLRAMAALVAEAEAELGARASVGVATPGSLSPRTGRLRNSNSVCLNGRPLGEDLAALLDRPVRLANDANCLALSEARDGAAAGAGTVFAAILGTGTGAGIAVDGTILSGANGIAGEWGHNPLPWPGPGETPGPSCWCGLQGCIETFLSGPGWLAREQAAGLDYASPEAMVAAAARGDANGEAALDRYADRLARALAQVINLLDPDVIVLGGGLGRITALYERVPARWARWIFSDRVITRLVPPRHGDSSGVRGAAWLWAPGEWPG